jgi:hypothetical protein
MFWKVDERVVMPRVTGLFYQIKNHVSQSLLFWISECGLLHCGIYHSCADLPLNLSYWSGSLLARSLIFRPSQCKFYNHSECLTEGEAMGLSRTQKPDSL